MRAVAAFLIWCTAECKCQRDLSRRDRLCIVVVPPCVTVCAVLFAHGWMEACKAVFSPAFYFAAVECAVLLFMAQCAAFALIRQNAGV